MPIITVRAIRCPSAEIDQRHPFAAIALNVLVRAMKRKGPAAGTLIEPPWGGGPWALTSWGFCYGAQTSVSFSRSPMVLTFLEDH